VIALNRSALGILTALTAYGIFGFSYLFTKVALEVTTPFVLLSVRFTVAFLTMSLIVLTGKVKVNLKGKPVRYLMGLGIVQPVLYFICENYGLSLTSASYSGIIMGMVPVSGMILGRLFLKEKVSAFQAVCAVCSVVGAALTAVGGPVAFSLLGTLLLIGSVFAGPLFNVISRSIADKFTAFERTYVMMGFGCAVFTVMALLQNHKDLAVILVPLRTPSFWVAVLYLAAGASVIAFMMVNYAVTYLSVARTTIYNNFSTVVSVLGGIIILKDSFTWVQIVGIVVILLGVFGVSWRKE
jgi:drug/metabolite transporter (DMT)-like permease